MERILTAPDTWTGGSIDLLIRVVPPGLDAIRGTLEAAWSWPRLSGPYLSNLIESDRQEPQPIPAVDLDETLHLYGVLEVPNGKKVAFSTVVMSDEEGDWIYCGSPLGSLAHSYPVGAFPFSRAPSDPWAMEMYGSLADLAQWIHGRVPFPRAIIGWLTTADLDVLLDPTLPADRYHGYLMQSSSGLVYYPPNVK